MAGSVVSVATPAPMRAAVASMAVQVAPAEARARVVLRELVATADSLVLPGPAGAVALAATAARARARVGLRPQGIRAQSGTPAVRVERVERVVRRRRVAPAARVALAATAAPVEPAETPAGTPAEMDSRVAWVVPVVPRAAVVWPAAGRAPGARRVRQVSVAQAAPGAGAARPRLRVRRLRRALMASPDSKAELAVRVALADRPEPVARRVREARAELAVPAVRAALVVIRTR